MSIINHIGTVETWLLCSLVSEMELMMCSGEVYLELRPRFSDSRSGLPCPTSVGEQSRVKYKDPGFAGKASRSVDLDRTVYLGSRSSA
jgi:hypothetical protein